MPVLEHGSGLRAGRDFGVAYNPEFLREGSAVADFFGGELTVVGVDDERSADALRRALSGHRRRASRSRRSRVAEMLKYVNNSFHALKVTFANEIGRVCKREGTRQPRGHAAVHARHAPQPRRRPT